MIDAFWVVRAVFSLNASLVRLFELLVVIDGLGLVFDSFDCGGSLVLRACLVSDEKIHIVLNTLVVTRSRVFLLLGSEQIFGEPEIFDYFLDLFELLLENLHENIDRHLKTDFLVEIPVLSKGCQLKEN